MSNFDFNEDEVYTPHRRTVSLSGGLRAPIGSILTVISSDYVAGMVEFDVENRGESLGIGTLSWNEAQQLLTPYNQPL